MNWGRPPPPRTDIVRFFDRFSYMMASLILLCLFQSSLHLPLLVQKLGVEGCVLVKLIVGDDIHKTLLKIQLVTPCPEALFPVHMF